MGLRPTKSDENARLQSPDREGRGFPPQRISQGGGRRHPISLRPSGQSQNTST